MEFKLSKNEMNDLLKEWIVFRDEELTRLTSEDKRHPLKFDEFEEKLVKSLPYKNRKFAKKMSLKRCMSIFLILVVIIMRSIIELGLVIA